MPEMFKEMRSFVHAYYCDTAGCEDIMMVPFAEGLAPGHTMYRCPKCKADKSLNKRLPQPFQIEAGLPFPPKFRQMVEDIMGPEKTAALDVYGGKKIVV